ncbi:MAG: polysaccharide biosynthesis/export family protein, partial [Nitrospiraceae bacterium]|nr:polysaccharide biosynthesis/export family protein [Nitrospiraceae bacterium]
MNRFLCFLGASAALLTGALAQIEEPNGGRLKVKPIPVAEEVRTADPRTESYLLTPHDTVRITVFGEDDLSTTAKIGKDFAVALPLVGLVKIGGQTVRQAATTLETKLRKYLVKPHVAVAIVDYSKRRFTILGQIGKPGIVELPDESSIDLIEAIGMAGGYTRLANPSKITLKRLVNGQERIFKLDGKTMLNNQATERFEVLPGDSIIVGER